MTEYIDTSVNPADYIEVWEAEDAEHGKQIVMAVDDLKCLPPADVRPVVRGRWYKPTGMMPPEFTGYHRCTECDELALRDWKSYKQVLTPFCPFCGADLRGGDPK